jgi:hypothetical protein
MPRPYFHRRISIALFATCAAALFTGCGEEQFRKVRGKLTVGGVPLAKASIVFAPIEGGQPAYGETDEDGSFVIRTVNPGDGAAPGEYAVLVTWEEQPHPYTTYRETSPKRAELEKDYKEWKAKHKVQVSPVPPEYGEPARTPLKVTVPLPDPVFNIDIPAREK